MALARETVRLGLGARGKAKIKVRQPLREAVVVADGRERAAIERLAEVVREELNVASIRFVAAARRARQLRGEGQLPLARARCSASRCRWRRPRSRRSTPQHVAEALRDGGSVGIEVGGREHTLTAEDLILTMRAPDGYSVEREGAHAVALDLNLDEELRREGLAREIVHAVQNARKDAGLQVEDRISLALGGDDALLAAAEAHRDYIAGETLAVQLTIAGATRRPTRGRTPDGAYRGEASVEEMQLGISLTRAAGA